MNDNITVRPRRNPIRYNSIEEAFFAHLTPGELTECWLWPSATTPSGYGIFTHKYKGYYAHRVAYEIYRGEIPAGLDVLHHCDTPRCCNPFLCLWLGTAKDNAADMMRKGRGRYKSFPGEQHFASKLNDNAVREIRNLAQTGMNQHEIACLYGVSQTTITQVVNRIVWKHVE